MLSGWLALAKSGAEESLPDLKCVNWLGGCLGFGSQLVGQGSIHWRSADSLAFNLVP